MLVASLKFALLSFLLSAALRFNVEPFLLDIKDNVEIELGKRHAEASSDMVNVGKLINFFWNSFMSMRELVI